MIARSQNAKEQGQERNEKSMFLDGSIDGQWPIETVLPVAPATVEVPPTLPRRVTFEDLNAPSEMGDLESPRLSTVNQSPRLVSTHLPEEGAFSGRCLYGIDNVSDYILGTLLAKPSLKGFHSLVRDCTRRINGKEIVCLRDLERTLILMASVSYSYLDNLVGQVAHSFSRRL